MYEIGGLMRKRIVIIGLAVSAALSSANAVSAMENGLSAVGNKRIMSNNIMSGSSFLYDDRIILTQGHTIMYKGKEQDLSFWRAYKPGTVIQYDSKYVNVIKTIVAPGYEDWNPMTDWARKNDFGILITDRPVAKVAKAKLASKAKIDALREAGAIVTTGGYGYQSLEDRNNRRNIFGIVPKMAKLKFANGDYLKSAVDTFVREAKMPGRGEFPENLGYHLLAPMGGPQTCDGDSGSGFFIETKKETLYLGTIGVHIGGANCGANSLVPNMTPLIGIEPVYKYIDLIKQAEAWVKAHPVKK
jgi:hypothetical protein